MPGELAAAIDYSTVNYKDARTVSGNLPNALLPVNDSNERPIHFVTGH